MIPGGSLEPLGRPWGAEGDFRAILGAFWETFGAPKLLNIDAKIDPEIQHPFGLSFWSSGVRFGVDFWLMLGSFWALVGCPPAKHENLDF